MRQPALIFQRANTPPVTPRLVGRVTTLTRIGVAERRILLVLARYHRLTAIQITRVLYRSGTLTTVQARLKRMTEQGMLGRDFPHGQQRAGSAP